MRNAFVIPFDTAESRVAEAMMGFVDDEAAHDLGHGSQDWTSYRRRVLRLGEPDKRPMVGAYCADDC